MESRSRRFPDDASAPLVTTTAVALTAVLVLAGCAGAGTPSAGSGEPAPAPPSASAASPVDAAPALDAADALRLTLELASTVDLRSEVAPPDVITSTPGTTTTTEVASRQGGGITVAAGPAGGAALRFPRFTTADAAPTAAVTVTGDSASWMNPGDLGFSFGADVVLDRRSSGSADDNGDNVVQRGLQVEDSQFKLQVDRRRPSCAFKGSRGLVYVGAERRLSPGDWYRLECARRDDEFVIAVARIRPDGTSGEIWQKTVTGDVGAILFPVTTPLAVGGKVTGPTEMVGAADQFNGSISRAFVGPW